MKQIVKVLSVFLVVLMVIQLLPLTTMANEYNEELAREEYLRETLSDYLYDLVDTKDITEVLQPEPYISQENPSGTVLTLKNEQGENVSYIFSEPIAFFDAEGKMQYKEIGIERQTDAKAMQDGYTHTNGTNDYRINFAEDAATGIQVQKDTVSWKLAVDQADKNITGELSSEKADNKGIGVFCYENAFGHDTVLKYYPQLNGVKEDIILNRYNGISEFSFSLVVDNGYAVLNEDNTVTIHNNTTGKVVDTFTPPYACDSIEKEDENSPALHYVDCEYSLEKVGEGEYLFSIVVPKAFLEAETTVYPVIIDPTTSSIYQSLDTPVYSGYPTSSYSSNAMNCFGRASEYGYGRVLTKFTVPSAINNYATISSAYLWVRELTGRTTTTYVRPYMNTTAFSNSTTWNTKPSCDTNVSMPSKNINSNSQDGGPSEYWYKFDIKNAVKEWTTGTTNNGLTFISDVESSGDYYWRAFASAEHGTSSYHPYAVITYTNDTTAPVITSVTGNPADWTSGSVTLTVNATDNASGVAYYSFDNGSTWQTGKTKTFSANQMVRVKVKDRAGNISAATSVNISRIMNRPYAFVSGDLLEIVMFEGADDIQRLEYNLNGGSWQTYTAPVRIVCTGNTQIQYRAVYSDTKYYSGTTVTMRGNVGVYKTKKDDLRNGSFMLPSGFVRTYNSSTKEWFFAFNANIQSLNSSNMLKYTDYYGNIEHYLIDEDDPYHYYSNDGKEIYYNPGVMYINNASVYFTYIIKNNNTSVYFDNTGKICAVVDGNQKVRYNWSGSSLVISDNHNRTYTVTFSGTNPTAVADCASHTVTYTWSNGKLTAVSNALNQIETYAYDTNGKLTQNGTEAISYTADGRTAQITQQTGSFLKYTYNDGYTDGETTGRVQASDGKGVSVFYAYAESFAMGGELSSYAEGAEYYGSASAVQLQSSDHSGYSGVAETVSRQQHISPSSVQVIPLGNTYYYVQYNYNENITGVLIAEYTDEQLEDENFTVPQTYNAALPYATQKIENTYSGLLLTQSVSSEKVDNVWTYVSKATNTYDSDGQLAYTWNYTFENNSWSLQSYEGYSYDTYGNCSAIYSYDFSVTPSVSFETFKTYNSLNQLTYESYSVDNEEEYAKTYSYDALGRVTSIYDYENTISYSYNSDGSIASYAYNNLVTTFNYSNGRLTSYTDSDNVTRTYTYDSYGNATGCAFDIYTLEYNTLGSLTKASVNNAEIVSYAYTGAAQNTSSETYANGQTVAYAYNADGEITSISLNDTPVYTYTYSTQNNEPVVTITDNAGNLTKTVADDLTAVYQNGIQLYSVEKHFGESGANDFYGAVYTFGSSNFTSINDEDKDTFKTGTAVAFEKEFTYDDYNLTETDISGVINEAYVYNDNGAITSLTNTLAAVTQGYAYTYDTDGNITGITKTVTQNNNTSTVTESYTYDGNNQLVTAIIGNKKWTYAYDTRGNITEKKEYTLSGNTQTLVNTDTFTYGNTAWQDELTAFNNQSITYDAAGNPTAYLGHTLTWTMGRRLASYDGISYTYNEEGIRTSKTSNGITARYYLCGTNVIGQTDGTNTLYFRYDSNNGLTSVIYNGTEFFYIKNRLGDITGIADSTGNIVAEYDYDPWGVVLSVTGSNTALANANPFRYRGYYYDSETGMYYLQSRYYDPEICRFINADKTNYIGATINIFEYCNNNPISHIDPTGEDYLDVLSILLARLYSFLAQLLTQRKTVTVISASSNEWIYSSAIMGQDLCDAANLNSSTVITPSSLSFFYDWRRIHSKFVIVHTHGSPEGIFDEINGNYPSIITVNNISSLYRNYNISCVIMTSCSTAGANGNNDNFAQALSKKISYNGIVVASEFIVSGAATSFVSSNNSSFVINSGWVIYKNGIMIDRISNPTITMESVYKFLKLHNYV